MIVGNGLIASAFIQARFDSPHHVIFASGVSNSLESDPLAYERELGLIKDYIDKNTTFVYFSTTSVFDPSRKNSTYIRHKLFIEDYIRKNASSHIIVRLPIMVGHSSNPHTLINYLVNAIHSQKHIQLHQKACRNLLAIDDLVPLMKPVVNHDQNQDVNILGSEKITLPALVAELENILDMKGNYSWTDEGECYDIPEDAGKIIYVDDVNYIHNILTRYFKK